MYTVDTTIDTIQSIKKQFATNFVFNETMRSSVIEMIDAETVFAKQFAKTVETSVNLVKDKFNYFPSK